MWPLFWGFRPFNWKISVKSIDVKGLKLKNKGHANFYDCCDLTKKVYLTLVWLICCKFPLAKGKSCKSLKAYTYFKGIYQEVVHFKMTNVLYFIFSLLYFILLYGIMHHEARFSNIYFFIIFQNNNTLKVIPIWLYIIII